MATKELFLVSAEVELDGGMTDEGKLKKLRRTLRYLNQEATPANVYDSLDALFALQEHPVLSVYQIDKSQLYN